MTPEVQSEYNKLKSLKQNKDITEAVLEKNAQRNVIIRDLVNSGQFINKNEQKEAKKVFENYLDKLDFENFSDLSTLSILVYNEMLLTRVQKTINEQTTKDGQSFISDKLVKTATDLTNQILSLKTKLGIDKEQKDDELTALQLLKKRFNKFIQFNRHEFTISVPYKCSGCQKEDVKICLLRRRVKDFEVFNHHSFAGRWYYNKTAMEMVKSGRITKEEYASIFATSVDYVTWCLKNEGKINS